ncbi:pollen-specific leucine-rich repeat extensin-like protein 1 [Lucilia cuprina]|uniref:pollen-specific leucine-rich repeat extensin-like protein 1 n=1 Tax=Lucilia cuprina TaxID=7375 RepID=UPI001F05C64F|nr:pollen-specific leucine-rich repeat extensin-like protein 1 [Lucilia cuprina]
MNMIMDSGHPHTIQRASPVQECPQAKDLQISTTPPTPPNDDSYQGNTNNQLSPKTTTSPTTKSTLKRSFDVAFLMMPDERLKNNQVEKQRPQPQFYQQLNKQPEIMVKQDLRRYPQIMVKTPRIYDDPTLVISSPDWEATPLRSAFTKVPSRLESPGQPAPPLSPDQLSCSSMSPPVATTPPRSASASSNDIISIDSLPSSPTSMSPNMIYQNFRPEYSPNGAFHSVQTLQTQRLKQQLLYRPNLSQEQQSAAPPPPSSPPEFFPVYPGFPFPHGANNVPHPFAGIPHPELPRIVQNPAAAAILSTLIPPTLASTFTLTAQNVCAKCNISFRMTSDLVYHMRSHHKSEVATDPNRRKREEKLKCPVCQESFRERHHLTRHMTAHQDKESDQTNSTTNSSPNSSFAGNSSRHSSQRPTAYNK